MFMEGVENAHAHFCDFCHTSRIRITLTSDEINMGI